MTPQEQQMVADLFDRLASLEGERRDPDAERVIRDGLARAPNAVYALVQTVLVQDEALKRANAHIEELEKAVKSEPAPSSGGFLDSMRNVFTAQSRGGSVPSVRPGGQGSSGAWNAPPPPPPGYAPQPGYPPPPPPGYMQGAPMGGGMMGGGGGSFLGTAAATVAGVVGGAMLLNGIRSAFGGGGGHQTFGSSEGGAFGASPWGGDRGGGELSRDAGVGDIGGRHGSAWNDQARADALQDQQQDLDDDQDEQQDYEEDYADDSGDFGDSDTA
jgi:hypothetical protein